MNVCGLRWYLTVALVLPIGAGCDREIPPGFESEPIVGYRIEGIVQDGFSHPISDVSITVKYLVEYVNSGPPPSRDYDVPDPPPFVRVRVYNADGGLIRTLYSGTPGVGSLYVPWDRTNGSGQLVPSGLYWVHYEVNNQSQKSYPVIVDETVTTRTDSSGSFTIFDRNLPLGFYPHAIYDFDGTTFGGNYRVGDRVFLTLRAAGITTYRTIIPERNRLTTVIVTFN